VSSRAPNRIARSILQKIPRRFVTDGCSSAPDSILGRDLRWCCKIHDWRGCTRAHRPGSLTQGACNFAAKELGWNVRSALRLGTRWIGWLYYRVTYRFTEVYWDSCGPEAGERCRHNLPMPGWMVYYARSDRVGG